MYNQLATTFSGGKAGHLIQPVASSKIRFNLKEIVMGRFQDLSGQKFGMLEIICRVPNKSRGHTRWYALCDCGNASTPSTNSLRTGNTKSCGCMRNAKNRQRAGGATRTHGLRRKEKKLYSVWNGMKQRCTNPNNEKYPRYGGRGIAVCGEWESDFYSFYRWMMDNGYKQGLTIDRIDNDGDYSPSNCRTATQSEQQHNTSRSVLTVDDVYVIRLMSNEGMGITSIAKMFNVSLSTIGNIIYGNAWKNA